jgi:hypothetical protein
MIQVWRTREDDPFEFDLEFDVVVNDEGGESRHHVTLARAAYARQTGGKCSPEACVEAAFRFLLDRERRQSILPRFDIDAISQYFPEFERELPNYLPRR